MRNNQIKRIVSGVLSVVALTSAATVNMPSPSDTPRIVNSVTAFSESDTIEVTVGDYIFTARIEDGCAVITDSRPLEFDKACYYIEIPSEIGGCPVTEIGTHSFGIEGNSFIVIPEAVKKIDREAVFNYKNYNVSYQIESMDIEIEENYNIFSHYPVFYVHKNSAAANEINSSLGIKNVYYLEDYIISDNLIYERNENGLKLVRFIPVIDDVVIPDEIDGIPVIEIDKLAFYGQNITSVYIPDSVKTIGVKTFSTNSKLIEARLPEGLTEIPDGCFEYCSKLKKADIPESVTRIGAEAFSGCEKLDIKKLPDNIEYVGGNAFYRTYLENLFWTDDRILIVDGFLISAADFNGEELVIPDNVTEICSFAFLGNKDLKKVVIPEGVKKIDSGAFYGCSSLETIVLPKSLEKISNSVFSFCTSVSEITIPENVSEIGSSAFHRCDSLKELVLPEKLEKIEASLLYGCGNLESVVIPDGVTEIGICAFSECKSLKEINIPKTVTIIGENAFRYCESITEIEIPENVTEIFGICSGCTSLEKAVLPDSITTIGYESFFNCSNLEEINIPKNLENVMAVAFANCTKLKKAVLTDKIKSIGSGAFRDCELITEITIPDTIELISDNAFQGCTGIKNVTMPEKKQFEMSRFAFEDTPWYDDLQAENDIVIINGMLVDALKCKGEFEIPDGVDIICSYAFGDFEKGSMVTSIKGAEKIKIFRDCAFVNCKELKEFTIPDTLEVIPYGMFSSCESLEKVVISESVKQIESGAFSWCDSLKELVIPKNVEYFGGLTDSNQGCSTTVIFENPNCFIDGGSINFPSFPYSAVLKGYADSTAYRIARAMELKFEEIYLEGDANADGELSVADLVTITKWLKSDYTYEEKLKSSKAADIDENGSIDVFDLIALRKMLLEN